MNDESMEDERILKRVFYRATYRGGKEADRILGGFVQTHAAQLPPQELKDLDALLQCDDGDIFAWLEQTEAIPHSLIPYPFNTTLLNRLRDYLNILRS
jgi:antitoxin CptB